jgi:hypothetical protein
MRLILYFILVAILCSFNVVGFAGAEVKPPAEGGVLPAIVLRVPDNSELQQYLGVSVKKTFTIPGIKAEVVLIEIFSMY